MQHSLQFHSFQLANIFFCIYACNGGLASIKMASDKCIFISVVSFNLIFYKESLFE